MSWIGLLKVDVNLSDVIISDLLYHNLTNSLLVRFMIARKI